MIILEGCDGTGKSFLAASLAIRFPWMVSFKDKHHRQGVERYVDFLQEDLTQTIWDRFHLGEVVYPKVLQDGRGVLSLSDWDMLELRLIDYKTVVVHCVVPEEIIRSNLMTRGDDLIQVEQVTKIVLGYAEAMALTKLPVITWNYITDDLDDLCELLKPYT